MTILIAALCGLLVGRATWTAMNPVFRHPMLQRENYRGASLPVGAGLVAVVAAVTLAAGLLLAHQIGWVERSAAIGATAPALITVIGFGLLGLVDDLLGDERKGFRGHLRTLVRGQITTGGLKVLGGAATGVIVAALARSDGGAQLLIDGAVIALAANLANLLDRRPGRATKVGVISVLALVAGSGAASSLVPVVAAVAAIAALLRLDLREKLMLGDTGANPLGAAVGLGVVLTASATGRSVALVILLLLNAVSEFVSFSRIIDAVAPLRALDRLGGVRHG